MKSSQDWRGFQHNVEINAPICGNREPSGTCRMQKPDFLIVCCAKYFKTLSGKNPTRRTQIPQNPPVTLAERPKGNRQSADKKTGRVYAFRTH